MFAALLLAASAAPAAPVPAMPPADWKPAIKNREFKFDDKHTGAKTTAGSVSKDAWVTAAYEPSPGGIGEGTFTVQKKDGPKVTVGAHSGTPIAVRGDVLYVANFSPAANGCSVTAYDLTTGKKAWEKPLDGIGRIAHFGYRNRVAMAVEKHPDADHFALVIVGWESSGKYVEVLDLATGKQLAHKKYEK
jgi:hypothetical protein